MDKLCTKCGAVKSLEEFNYKIKAKQKYQAHCKVCTRHYLKTHYANNTSYYKKKARKHTKRYIMQARQAVYEFKLSNPCSTCGEPDPRVLEFNHIQPSEKSHNVSEMVKAGYSKGAIVKEIYKCEVLCANCHRRKTAEDFEYYSHKKWDKK